MVHTGLKPGFTLVELMVAVALVTLVLGVGVGYLNSPQYQLRAEVFALHSALQRTEFAAVKRNRNAYLDFDVNGAGVGNAALTCWVDNNSNAQFDGGAELLETLAQTTGVAYGSVPSSEGGPKQSPDGESIPSNGVSFSGSGNAERAEFSPDGTSNTGAIYLCLADNPAAGTYALLLNSIGYIESWYFRTGGTSWQEQ